MIRAGLAQRFVAPCALVAACAHPSDAPSNGSEPPDAAPDVAAATDSPDAGSVGVVRPGADLEVRLGPAQPCLLPSDVPVVPHEGGEAWRAQIVSPDAPRLFASAGVAAGDWDEDGLLDLAVARPGRVDLWRQGEDLTFTPIPAPSAAANVVGLTPVDLDDDGHLDLVLASFRNGVKAWRGDGRGGFVEEADPFGIGTASRWASASFGDLDGDGDLDAFVAGYGALSDEGGLPPGDPSALLVRDGATWVDQVPSLPGRPDGDHPLRSGHTFGAAWTDLDGDGALDLYVVNDFGWVWPSLALWNRDGVPRLEQARGLEQRRENMGLALGDLDGDGLPEILVAAWDALGLFVDGGSGRWFDVAASRGLVLDASRGQHVAWATELADLDADGDLDALVVAGVLDVRSDNPNPPEQPDACFVQQPDGTFVDRAAAWGLDTAGAGRGLVVADLDRDGALDVVKPEIDGGVHLFRGACTGGAWLRVQLVQPAPNRSAIGARIRAHGAERTVTTELRAGGTSYGSGGPPEAWLGLGDADVVDLEIRWPDGRVDLVADVPTRRAVEVRR